MDLDHLMGVTTEINGLTEDAQNLSFIGTRMISYLFFQVTRATKGQHTLVMLRLGSETWRDISSNFRRILRPTGLWHREMTIGPRHNESDDVLGEVCKLFPRPIQHGLRPNNSTS